MKKNILEEVLRKQIRKILSEQRYLSCRWKYGLELGCEGDDVLRLQSALQVLGYNIQNDSYLGAQTMKAYRNWAKKNNAHIDSIPPVAYKKLIKQASKIEQDIVSSVEKGLDMKKSRASRPGQPLDQPIPIKAANIEDKKLKESKFSNDKELQNLMESFKTFTRND